MPATTKDELVSATESEFQKLWDLIQKIDDGHALTEDADDTSIKDIVAHRAHWIGLFLIWHQNGRAGKAVHMPAKGYKWNELKAYNAALRQKQATLSWPRAKKELQENHNRLTALITSLSQSDLYSAPMKGGNGTWTVGRFAEANGASHYRSAARDIRKRLRGLH